MSTMQAPAQRGGAATLRPPHRVGFLPVFVSEWTKLRTIRSTVWTLGVALVVTMAVGIIASGVISGHWDQLDALDRRTFNPMDATLAGLYLGQLVLVAFAVMAITGEYSTGMIRTSLTAVPARGKLYAAKLLNVALISFVLGEIASFVAFIVSQSLLSNTGRQVHLGDPGVARAVIGGGLFLMVMALFAFGIGAILRHTAGAITLVLGILLVLPVILRLILNSFSWRDNVLKYLPDAAGSAVWSWNPPGDLPDTSTLSPWAGFAVLCAYTAAVLAGGYLVLKSRDA